MWVCAGMCAQAGWGGIYVCSVWIDLLMCFVRDRVQGCAQFVRLDYFCICSHCTVFLKMAMFVCILVHSYVAGPGEEGNRVVIQVCLFFSRGCLLLQLH